MMIKGGRIRVQQVHAQRIAYKDWDRQKKVNDTLYQYVKNGTYCTCKRMHIQYCIFPKRCASDMHLSGLDLNPHLF